VKVKINSCALLTSAPMRVVNVRPRALPVTCRSECLMGHRASLDVEEQKNVSASAINPCSQLVFLLNKPLQFTKSQVAMEKCIKNKILAEIILQGKDKS
jgi:hypothetical protein